MRLIISWLQNGHWSIRTKLMSGFAIICLFLVILSVLSIFTLGELGNKINTVSTAQEQVTNARSVAEIAKSLETALTFLNEDMVALDLINNSAVKGQLNPNDANIQSQPYIVDYSRQRTYIQDQVNQLRSFSPNFALDGAAGFSPTAFMQMMDETFAALLSKIDQVKTDTVNKQYQKAIDGWKATSPEVTQAVEGITLFRMNTDDAVKQVTAISRRSVQEANTTRNNTQLWLALVGVIVVLLALIFGLSLTYAFTGPVEQFRGRLMQLAEGDLFTPLNVPNRDQFGDLALTFNQSLSRLGGVVEQFQSQALRVSSAAAQIAAASRQSALISADQAGAVAEATVTIEELSHTAQQIAEAATLVAGAAEQALNSASDGQDTVRTSILGISTLKVQVQDIAVKILALSERSQRVGHIIEQITSIADQTHLLALNAAIESAAAGENGKRFAVVAAEVKKLSESSRKATKEVQTVLSEIQGATNASVMATEQGMKEAERGVALAHKSGDANESIIQMVERTVQLANAISLATQQQRSASEQVVASMRQLATVIQDGAASAKQSSSLAIALDEIALELRRLSSQFKVEKGAVTEEGDAFGADGGPLEEFGDRLSTTAPLFVNSGNGYEDDQTIS